MNRPHALRVPFLILLLVLASLMLASCGGGSDDDSGSADGDDAGEVEGGDDSSGARTFEPLDASKDWVVNLETGMGTITITLDPEQSPNATANFVQLVEDGFYDGLTFHRVIEGFMIQGGDPNGDGTGGPGYTIADDEVTGEYERGVVAMARTPMPDSAGSQFFIVHGDEAGGATAQLGKDYAILGTIDDASMKVLDKIATAKVVADEMGALQVPVKPVVIKRATLAK